jgi:transmembrane protein 18
MDTSDWTTEQVLEFAKRDATQQGHRLQTEYTFTENALGFYHAVAWSKDRWIFCIFAIQILTLVAVVCARRAEVQLQALLFLIVVAFAGGASILNAWAHTNWELFSSQDYFDRRGTFMSVIWTAPFILILLIQLIFMVKLTADLAVKAGRLKVRANIRKNQKQKNASVGGGEGESSAGEDKTKKTSRRKKKKEQ